MKISQTIKAALVILGAVIVVGGTAYAMGSKPHSEQAAGSDMEKKVAAQAVYVCPDCHTMAMAAGKCSMCGKDMKQMHVLGMKDGQVMMCECSADCKCDAKGVKDGKCACGKEVSMMTPKGMYVCACPGAKCCSTISDKPGKCACGHDMKKVE